MTSAPASFEFQVSRVERLPRINRGVLEGRVLQGVVLPGQNLLLVHGDRRMPMRVDGVLMGMRQPPQGEGVLSLAFPLRTMAFDLVGPGDKLVAA